MEQLLYLILAIIGGVLGLRFFGDKKDPNFEKKEEELEEKDQDLRNKINAIESEKDRIRSGGVEDLDGIEVVDYWNRENKDD